MSLVVVDASTVVHWLIPGIFSAPATRLLESGQRLLAPALLLPEVGNAIWKYHRQRLINREEAEIALALLTGAPIALEPSHRLIARGFGIAADFDRSLYDSLYLALALDADAPFVTADRKLRNALTDTSIGKHVV